MDGDGHTAAFNGVSPCVDLTVTAYLVSLRLPPEGTVCPQQVEPFGPAAGLMARARRILDGVGPIPTAVATAGPRRR